MRWLQGGGVVLLMLGACSPLAVSDGDTSTVDGAVAAEASTSDSDGSVPADVADARTDDAPARDVDSPDRVDAGREGDAGGGIEDVPRGTDVVLIDRPASDVGDVDATTFDAGSMDAGRDAGSVDTSAADVRPIDAGPMDVGVDVRPIDVGVDVGTIDVGVDVRPTDTGPADVGTTDTGPADVGTTDTGPADAGTADAGLPSAWTMERVAPLVGAAEDAAIAVDGADREYVCFRDHVYQDLRFMTNASGSWVSESVEGGDDWHADTGHSCEIVLDASNTPHIFYVDRARLVVRHATRAGGAWRAETIAPFDGGTFPGTSTQATPGRLRAVFDGGGVPTIAWIDALGLRASRLTAGAWSTIRIAILPVSGLRFGLARDPAGRAVLSYVLSSGGRPALSTFDGTAWRPVTPAFPTTGSPGPVYALLYSPTGDIHILCGSLHFLFNGSSWESHSFGASSRGDYAVAPDGVIYGALSASTTGFVSQATWDGSSWRSLRYATEARFAEGRIAIGPTGARHMLAWPEAYASDPGDLSVARPTATTLNTEMIQRATWCYGRGGATDPVGREMVGVECRQRSLGSAYRSYEYVRSDSGVLEIDLPRNVQAQAPVMGRDGSIHVNAYRLSGSSWTMEPYTVGGRTYAIDSTGTPTNCEGGDTVTATRFSDGMWRAYNLSATRRSRGCGAFVGAMDLTQVVTATDAGTVLLGRWNGMRFGVTELPLPMTEPSFQATDDGTIHAAYNAGGVVVRVSRISGGVVETQDLSRTLELGFELVLRLDGSGRYGIASRGRHNLMYASDRSGSWTYETVIAETGMFSSLTAFLLSASGSPALYVNNNGGLRRLSRR
ncbi:MAG: hypothetical protein Q7V43_34975 [Myxococcales bacterium]|nr:hypothetical protein [Myxococcales bacterium]